MAVDTCRLYSMCRLIFVALFCKVSFRINVKCLLVAHNLSGLICDETQKDSRNDTRSDTQKDTQQTDKEILNFLCFTD